MKKKISFVFLFVLLTLSACSKGNTSITSYIQIVEKEHSDDNKEAWIIAFDPNNQTKSDSIKILVDEPMVWNLIEVDKTYFANYTKESDEPWKLEQIEHEIDSNALR